MLEQIPLDTADRPFGYDTDSRWRLDGSDVLFRPLGPGDRPLVRELLDGLGHRSRYLRFFTPMPRIEDDLVRRLCTAEPGDLALGAFGAGRLLGMGRFVRLADDQGAAELAVTVAENVQGRGLGRRIVDALRRAAASDGIERLTFQVAGDNHAMLGLLRSLGARLRAGGGVVAAELAVGSAYSTAPAGGSTPRPFSA
jgi:RimJ/RimL family protein N-acetyltransferase